MIKRTEQCFQPINLWDIYNEITASWNETPGKNGFFQNILQKSYLQKCNF